MTDFLPYWLKANQTAGKSTTALSHVYGDISTGYTWGDISGFKNNPNVDYYLDEEYIRGVYRFTDTFQDPNKYGAYYTNRSVNSSSSCTEFTVTTNYYGTASTTIGFLNETGQNQTVYSPFLSLGGSSTTYILPNQDAWGACGPRCSEIWVFKAASTDFDPSTAQFFKCNTSLTTVTNPYLEEHKINDFVATLIAGSIGATGYEASSLPFDEDLESNRYTSG